jgi:F-type H+-transporting ATPase subunit delta
VDRPLGSARRYAAALLGLAKDPSTAASLADELDRLAAVIASPGARQILDDPRTPAEGRAAAIATAAGGTLSAHIRTLIGMLARRRMLASIPAIAEATRDALNARNGITIARVVTAVEASPAERTRFESQAAVMAGRAVQMSYEVDASLVGGATLRVGDRLVDGSVKGRLSRMRERILSVAG